MTGEHPPIEAHIPVQWMLDDWIHFGFDPGDCEKSIATPSDVREIWSTSLRASTSGEGSLFPPCNHKSLADLHAWAFWMNLTPS